MRKISLIIVVGLMLSACMSSSKPSSLYDSYLGLGRYISEEDAAIQEKLQEKRQQALFLQKERLRILADIKILERQAQEDKQKAAVAKQKSQSEDQKALLSDKKLTTDRYIDGVGYSTVDGGMKVKPDVVDLHNEQERYMDGLGYPKTPVAVQKTGVVKPSQPSPLSLGQSCPWVVVDNSQVGVYGVQQIRNNVTLDYDHLAKQTEYGRTELLVLDRQEVFVTYQRSSLEKDVHCREYEVVATIKGEPVIDLQTVCRTEGGVWQLL